MKIKGMDKNKRKEFLVTMVILFLFWMVLSAPSNAFALVSMGNFVQHIVVGLILAFIVTIIVDRPLLTYKEISTHRLVNLYRLSIYIIQLMYAIVLAGIDVAKRVLRRDLLISPGIVEFYTPLQDDLSITMNANSITLTPGTITIDVKKTEDGSIFWVHCISDEAVKSMIEDGGFVKKILDIYE